MITLTQAERLVRKIAEVTGEPASDTQMAKLAQDYSDLCRGANLRLEQCAIMIEAGQFLPALQLAETPPPLLDLITVLSFRQSSDWRNYCQRHQLPWTEPFYDKYVRLLSSTYNRGIAGDHPFYRDYRRAVMHSDDDRAISILRVIARLNPSDENTKEELKRLEGKLLRGQLENLRQILAKGDDAAVQAQVAQIEASGLPVPSAHPVWQQAQGVRCQQLLRRAEDFRQQDAWQDAEVLMEEIHVIATQYKAQMPADAAECCASLESWTKAQRAAFTDDQDFQRAVSALEHEVKTIESKQATDPRPRLAELTSLSNSLAAKSSEAQRFNRPLDQSLTTRCQQCQDWLQNGMKKANRKRLVATIAVMLLVVGAISAAVFFVSVWSQQRELVRHLEELRTSHRVPEMEDVLKTIPPRWKTEPPVADEIAKAINFLASEYALERTFNSNMSRLRQLSNGDFQGGAAETGALRKQCEDSLAKLAPGLQPTNRSALDAWDSKWQAFRNAMLSKHLDHSDQIAPFLQGTNGYVVVRDALDMLQSDETIMEPWITKPPELDTNLRARFIEMVDKIADWKDKCEYWTNAQSNLLGAQSLDQYLNCLDELALSPFANEAQRHGAARIKSLGIDEASLLGELILPNHRSEWPSLTNLDTWQTNLMPKAPITTNESRVYAILRDDKNMYDIWSYKLTAVPNTPYRTHIIYVQGSLTNDPQRIGHMVGMVYDTEDKDTPTDHVAYVRKPYSDLDYSSFDKLKTNQESVTYDHLELTNLIGGETGDYQKPILQLLDQLNQEKSSAVFRAIVSLRLFALADLRRREWGLVWCPDAAKHIQAIKDLGAQSLRSGDWMIPSVRDKMTPSGETIENALSKHFTAACAVSLEKQARFLQELTHDACAAGFAFAGFVESDGRPVLRPISPYDPSWSDPDYWGWDNGHTPSVALLFRKTTGGNALLKITDPLPFTPLFVFQGDRQRLVNHAAVDATYPASQVEDVLPRFFVQSQK